MPDAEHPSRAIREHLKRFWPERFHEEFTWTLGPVQGSLPGFRVVRVAPQSKSDPWIYVTVGAWAATRDEEHSNEFFLLAPSEDARHIELLAMVANLHADERHRLRQGTVLEIGRPWASGSVADHLLVSLPLPYGPTFEQIQVGTRHIQVLRLVPITQSEATAAREHGVSWLEDRLEASGADVLDPSRASVT